MCPRVEITVPDMGSPFNRRARRAVPDIPNIQNILDIPDIQKIPDVPDITDIQDIQDIQENPKKKTTTWWVGEKSNLKK